MVIFICYIVSLRHLKNLKNFGVEAEKQLDKNIKLFRSNSGGEYLFGDFDKYLLDNEILSQLLAPGML